jgi:CHAD domain-containing protein
MAYQFERNESVAEGVRRIAMEELTSAADQLNGSKPEDLDTAIHEARKSVKKTRALLRLMKTELGEFYQRDNQRLQDIGQQLSDIRDAGAIIGTFDQVIKHHKGKLPQRAIRTMRDELDRRKEEKKDSARLSDVLPCVATSLRSVANDARLWPLKRDGFQALKPGLKRILKSGRKAMKIARKDPEPEKLHDWRKRVKDHLYHVRLLEHAWTDELEAWESSLKHLETWLGDDHNLVVLCDQIGNDRKHFGRSEDVEKFLVLAKKSQEDLREKALWLGKKIHGEKPRAMVARLAEFWDGWQREPRTVKAS